MFVWFEGDDAGDGNGPGLLRRPTYKGRGQALSYQQTLQHSLQRLWQSSDSLRGRGNDPKSVSSPQNPRRAGTYDRLRVVEARLN